VRTTFWLVNISPHRVVGVGVGDGVMGGSGPTDIDALILPYAYADLAALAFTFGNLASLPAFDAKTEERRSGAMVNFMLDVSDR
jgi:hypothetical protein